MSDSKLRDQLSVLAASLFDRGYTHGSTGNISVRTDDGGLLVSPTGTSFGRLDPARLSRFDSQGNLVSGDQPTKELPLHTAFYDTRRSTGAVIHLHSTHAVAWSMTPGLDEDDMLPPVTAYSIMQLGRVKLLPFFVPGDPAAGDAVRALAGRHSAVMLANHGPIVAATSIEAASNAIEELEQTARIALLLQGSSATTLTGDQVAAVIAKFGIDRTS